MNNYFILLAAGKGKRFKSKMPKQYTYYKQKQIIFHSIDKAVNSQLFKKIILVINKKHKKYLNKINNNKTVVIYGGNERYNSTLNALKYLKKLSPENVFVHDSARPNFSLKLLDKINNKLKNNIAVVPVLKTNDSVKFVNNQTKLNLDRNNIYLAQTPQAFNFKILYGLFKNNYNIISDESSLFINNGIKIKFIDGEKNNFKITNNEDAKKKELNLKYGIGFDIHKLKLGKKLYLGGLHIPFHSGLKGHSDGDIIIHAVIDSILGAINKMDIGKFFPSNSSKYKNVRSTNMLRRILVILNKNKSEINNIDINLICEKPKVSKFRNKIIKSLSKFLKIDQSKINLKGKTVEKLGLIGNEKAIACEVITSINKYDK